MKKILVTALLTCFYVVATAQTKAIVLDTVSTPTVQCDMCKKKIEEVLKRYDGVMTVKVNIKAKKTSVKYITDRTNIEIIKAAIANAGYDADEIAANPEVYKTLPKCCKKPEEKKTE